MVTDEDEDVDEIKRSTRDLNKKLNYNFVLFLCTCFSFFFLRHDPQIQFRFRRGGKYKS